MAVSRYRMFSRIRPSKDSVLEIISRHRVRLDADGRALELRFDDVLSPRASQEDVFNSVKPTILDPVCAKRNATIIAYGPTGSGKTFTIFGSTGNGSVNKEGLVPRCLRELFAVYPVLSVSIMELYNDTLIDLLDPGGNLEMRVTPNSGVQVPELTTVPLTKTQ